MSTPKDVEQLMPIVLRGIADLLETPEEKLPAGLVGLLQNFGAACFEKGIESAHGADTIPSQDDRPTAPSDIRGRTNKSFPSPAPAHLPPPPRVPTIFTQETRRPPKSSKAPRKNRSGRGDKNSE